MPMSIKHNLVGAWLTALLISPCGTPHAASLQVAPVLVEVPAPGATATLKLRNEGSQPLDAQIRVFQWTQVDGADVLTPTNDVAASPPVANLRPNTDYTVRIVRTKKEPVAKEEAYRLLIDELPQATPGTASGVNIALRYSIPVFFTAQVGAPPKLK
jgi:fimbrial chaperone protein